MKKVLLMRRATFAAVSVLVLSAAGPAFAGISDFSIARDATLAAGDNQVTVTGTVSCPVGETVNVNVQVSQIVHGQVLAQAFGGTGNFTCTGTVESWTATANTGVPMQHGRASALGNAFAFPPSGPSESATTSAEVKLQEIH